MSASAAVAVQSGASPAAAVPVASASGSPVTYVTAPTVTYAAPVASQPAYAMASQLAMDWSASGVPVTSTAAPFAAAPSTTQVYAAPAVYACPPEIFAKLAAGGALTAEEMQQLTGQAPAPAVVDAVEQVAAVTSEPAPGSSKAASKKKGSKKKESLKASKKKSKGCC